MTVWIVLLVLVVALAGIATFYRMNLYDGRASLAQVVPRVLGNLRLVDGATPLGCSVATFKTDTSIGADLFKRADVSRDAVVVKRPKYLHYAAWHNLPLPEAIVSPEPEVNDALAAVGTALTCDKDPAFSNDLASRLFHSSGYWTMDKYGGVFIAVFADNTLVVAAH